MFCNCIGGNPCPCQRSARDIAALLAKARTHVMTPKEIYEQKVSWIFGMLPFDSKTTEAEVREHLAEMGVVDPEPSPDKGAER